MVSYCSREDVKQALDVAETARSNVQVDRAVESGARSVEGLLRRYFYPQVATRYFDWPNLQNTWTHRLKLGKDEVISIDTLKIAGTTIASTDYFLEPRNSGPPYKYIDINLANVNDVEFDSFADTHQRAVEITGLWGYTAEEEAVGELAASLAADADATASATWTTGRLGVGDILHINDERMIVTRRTMVDSTQDLGGDLIASTANTAVLITDGSAFAEDMIILVDSERMLVVDVAGNTLTVKRQWDGSVLAAHSTGANIFTLTGVELQRAALGTTLAAHALADTIYRHLVPGLVRELNIAEAINTIEQERSGYARTVGVGETERLVGGRGLMDVRNEARARYGRLAHARAV
jgi:hypothetical protein